MKTRLMMATAALITLVCLLVGTVFAWVSFGDSTSSMVFKIARINSKITLYKYIDSNYNGIPDYIRDDESGEMRAAKSLIGEQAALEESAAIVSMKMEINNVLPSQIHSFSLEIVNNSEAKNEIRIAFTGFFQSNYNDGQGGALYGGEDFDRFIDMMKVMSVRAGVVNPDGSVEYTDKFFFATLMFTNDPDNPENRPATVFSGKESPYGRPDIAYGIEIGSILTPDLASTVELILRFEFESLETLNRPVEQGGAGLYLDYNTYQAYMGKTFKLPVMSVYLEING